MRKEDAEFVRSGLRYYPEARQTVAHFKVLVVESLTRGLGRWRAVKKASRGSGKSVEDYIEVSQLVFLVGGDEAEVSIGLGWENSEPYLYVYCGNGPDWARHPTGAGFEIDSSWNLLSRSLVGEGLDLDAEIEQILSEWQTALRPPGSQTT